MAQLERVGVSISTNDTASAFSASDRDKPVRGNAIPQVSTSNNSPQDLLRQIDAARHALEAQLDALRGASTQVQRDIGANATVRLRGLDLLRDQLVGGATDVAALRADIMAAVAATLAYTSEARSAASTTQAGAAEQTARLTLADASAAAHETVTNFERDFFGRRIFDPYLRFASAEDQEAYRQREQERRRDIEKALAEGTPEGNLRASRLSLAQLEDAGAHGADRSPDYNRWHDDLRASTTQLSAAMDPARPRKAATIAKAVTEEKPEASFSPELLASLRGAGVTMPDQGGTGHGVAAKPVNKPDQPLPPH